MPKDTPAPNDMRFAVVTGASSGIGLALAKRLAQEGYDLVLAGRDADRLADAADEIVALGRRVAVRQVDLSDPYELEDFAATLTVQVPDVLVNNAGFGAYGHFAGIDPGLTLNMIDTNVTALARLTAAVLPGMLARGEGRILNVASTGAFAPLPFSAVYGATKAFVLSFSEAVAEELKGSPVTVTALCPGPTATRFFDRAGWDGTRLFKGPMVTAETVADCGVKAMAAGRRVAVVGLLNKVMIFAIRLAPRRLVGEATRFMLASRSR
ncbi:SDR family NAD(P)-dependent oxidoreductase [Xanthobacter agilis]|uniref:Short-subunit dehydrogenase n=1 Tax=Xanthobacter agilis TaxID=47492 RepID=A0ABU0L9S4_XANAG|nr:SDR family oxidoreductase [Xanthobacter agilis]MDQ0503888.1 short-subunit dehydrogenase [Xanthobacter agilis]